jgi:PhnB protein
MMHSKLTLGVARQLGATVVTEPTDFFGDTFSRFRDPWSNLWWVYRHGGQAGDGDEGGDWSDADGGAGGKGWERSSPELAYLHDTLLQVMPQLQDPRPATP